MKTHTPPSPAELIAIRSGVLRECVFHGEIFKGAGIAEEWMLALDDEISVTALEGALQAQELCRQAVLSAVNGAPHECSACREKLKSEHDECESAYPRLSFG